MVLQWRLRYRQQHKFAVLPAPRGPVRTGMKSVTAFVQRCCGCTGLRSSKGKCRKGQSLIPVIQLSSTLGGGDEMISLATNSAHPGAGRDPL